MERQCWLEDLPATIATVTDRWGLSLGEPYQPGGQCSWVAPTGDGRVVKLGWMHPEALHEADALRLWDGNGAVVLHHQLVIGQTNALLLERCDPGTTLKALPEPEQDPIVAGLLRRLWRPAPPGFRPLHEMCDQWAASASAPDSLTHEGIALFRELPREVTDNVLLLTDLHADNILASAREPWLVIDPKPYAGDPHYDALQHLLNSSRLHDNPDHLVRRMAGLLDLDHRRLRLWLFARCCIEAADDPALAAVARRIRP